MRQRKCSPFVLTTCRAYLADVLIRVSKTLKTMVLVDVDVKCTQAN